MDAAAPNKTTASQPQGAMQMSVINPAPVHNNQEGQQCEHGKARRIRGGGAARDTFLAAIECFICFECCKDCCECCADIICCPCEMCC